MALIRWRPSTELWNLLDTSLRRHGELSTEAFSPALNIVEEKDNFLVKVDLPGLSKEDVSVTIQDGFLIIKGERKYETEKKDSNYYHRERVHGTFSRSLQLPTLIDATKVLATFRDGVLHVTLPKSEEAKPKEIKVSVN